MSSGPALTDLSAAALLQAPYLAGMVRLVAARRRSLRAADIPPIAPDALAAIPACAWEDLRVSLRPSVQVVISPWPVLSLWNGRVPASGCPSNRGEEVLVVRCADSVAMHPLPPGGAAFVSALRCGATFADARATARQVPGFEVIEVLALLFSTQSIARLERA